MKAIHVVATLSHGGTEVTCRDLVRSLAIGKQVQSHVVALQQGAGTITAELENASGAPVAVLPPDRLGRWLQFYRLCRKLRPQAVVLHFFGIDHVLLALAARAAGIRNYHSKAGNPAPRPESSDARKWSMVIALSRWVDCPIISASEWIEQSLKRLGKLPPWSRVIHNGCDVERLSGRAAKAAAERDRSQFVVGMISRLDPIKDHRTLITAFGEVRSASAPLPLRLRIIGEGSLREELQDLAHTLGCGEDVAFLGNRADVPEQLGGLDLFVLSTTRDEGFGIVLIEAMAAQTPIVASDVPACREVLGGGRWGALVPPGDAAALAHEIRARVEAWRSGAARATPPLSEVEIAYGLRRLAEAHWTVMNRGLG